MARPSMSSLIRIHRSDIEGLIIRMFFAWEEGGDNKSTSGTALRLG
jgi:hypothetical protein